MKAIRPLYDEHGAEGYYREHAQDYQNPHFREIQDLLERNLTRFDCSGPVLDFAAGGGEVTQVLQASGMHNITGCDPFTHALYENQTGRPCLQFSFRDIVKGASFGSYSLIISSFALHLCPLKDLFSLTWNLLQAAPMLVVITPHKRPQLEDLPGVQLAWEDFTTTGREKKVRMKAYRHG